MKNKFLLVEIVLPEKKELFNHAHQGTFGYGCSFPEKVVRKKQEGSLQEK
jgi:hypothetical protein